MHSLSLGDCLFSSYSTCSYAMRLRATNNRFSLYVEVFKILSSLNKLYVSVHVHSQTTMIQTLNPMSTIQRTS